MTIRLFKSTFLVCFMLFLHSLKAQTSDNNWNPALAGQYPSTDVYCSAVVGNYAYIGGLFLEVGGNTNLKNLARFNFQTNQWEQVPQISSSFTGAVRAFKVDSDGNLWVAGEFTTIGSMTVNRIAKFNTSTNTWSRLMDAEDNIGHSIGAIYTMEISGDDLYIGGQSWGADTSRLQCIRKFNFSTLEWSSLDKGIHGANTTVRAIVADGNGNIYVGGHFSKVNNDNTPAGLGGIDANHIAKWDGSSWTSLSSGMTELVNNNSTYSGLPWVKTLEYDQTNQILYAGGGFLKAGGTNVRNVAKWDGNTWTSMAGGFEKEVYAIKKNGSHLYVGGQFLSDFSSSNSLNRHASDWNGTTWIPLGTGLGQESVTQAVLTIAAAGNNVFFGGTFYDVATYTGPNGIRRFAHWREILNTTHVSQIEASINVFPNPSSNEIQLNGLQAKSLVSILDLTGKVIYSTEVDSEKLTLQLNSYQKGLYVLIVESSKGKTSMNFVIE